MVDLTKRIHNISDGYRFRYGLLELLKPSNWLEQRKYRTQRLQRGWADSETVSADRAAAIRADHLRAFSKGLTAAVSKRFKSAFDEVASVFGLAGADKSLSARASAEADASRAREADPSFSAEAGSETRLSTTVSRTIRGFNTGSIFKALDELDRRRELQLEQQRKNDRSYSPRF